MVAGLWYSSATGCGLVGIWLSILVFNLVQFFGVLYQVLLVASLLRPTVDDLSLSLSLSPPPPPPPSLCTRTGVCTVHTPRLCVYDACAVHTDVCKFLETGCALPEEIRHSLLFFFLADRHLRALCSCSCSDVHWRASVKSKREKDDEQINGIKDDT
jgi:hypothetical protein